MFICNQCLKENFTNAPSLFKSHGRCEICDHSAVCSDIKSSYLEPKTAVKDENTSIVIKK